jgi:hypothetical protein
MYSLYAKKAKKKIFLGCKLRNNYDLGDFAHYRPRPSFVL